MLLARRGYRVLPVDRARFSQGHDLHALHLADDYCPSVGLGAAGPRAVSNTPPIETIEFDIGPFALRTTPPPIRELCGAYCARRKVPGLDREQERPTRGRAYLSAGTDRRRPDVTLSSNDLRHAGKEMADGAVYIAAPSDRNERMALSVCPKPEPTIAP
jgi:hypothetical protein